jgi:hypothetical protein
VLAITSTFVAALFAPALAAEAQLVPLQDYIGQSRVEKDPVALGYVAERCSALYSVFGKNLEGETDPERQRVMAEAFNAGERFMGLAVKLMISGTTMCGGCPAANSKNVADLGNLYIDRIEAARLRTGNMFSDHLIVGDFATCKGLLAKL